MTTKTAMQQINGGFRVMKERLKVSREVADAIECVKRECYGFYSAINIHIKNGWTSEERMPLSQLTVEQLATALIVGYEVRMTPHEVIANEHRRTVKEAVDGRTGRFELTELGIEKRKSFVEGIEFVLDTLNIKIEGVNDNGN